MFSKEESLFIKKEFWVQFAEVYPRKWLLYNTKIKDVSFKFYIDNKKAQVSLDIEPKEIISTKRCDKPDNRIVRSGLGIRV